MHKRVRKLIKHLKSASMTTAEREHIREALFHHMEQHPVEEDALVRRMLQGGGTFRPEPKRQPIPLMRFAPALALVVLLAAGGGASYAAEGAVPGDLLYPVKIHVNESVRSVMVRKPEARAAWEAERMERRLKEAQKLAARGELDGEKSAQLSESVARQSEALALRINDIEANDRVAADEARVDAALTLATHNEVLSEIVAGSMMGESGSETEADMIIAAIQKTSESLAEVEEAVDVAAASLPTEDSEELAPREPPQEMVDAANRRYENAENTIASARLLLSENRENIGELVALQASRTLRAADEELHAGEADLELRLYAAATEHFTNALRLAMRANLLIEANLELSVEIEITHDGTAADGETTSEEEDATDNSAAPDATSGEGSDSSTTSDSDGEDPAADTETAA